MRWRWSGLLSLMLVLARSGVLTSSVAHAAPRTWTVCNAQAGCSFTPDFTAIQPAISVASDGDTIDVYGSPAAYTGNLGIGNVSVTLEGVGAGTVTIGNNNVAGGPVITVGVSGAASQPTVTLQNLTITGGNDTAANGGNGGGILNYATLTVITSTVTGNHADNNGGGMYNGGTLSVTASTINGNSVSYGDAGGMDNFGTLTVTNSTISGNSSRYSGGMHNSGTLSVTNSTITGNSASDTGGIYNETGSVSLGNTILAHNTGGSISVHGSDCLGTFTDLPGGHGHNLIGDGSWVDGLNMPNSCGFTNGVNGDQVGSSSNPLDPQLAALAADGGPTPTMALLPGSPAINTGDTSTCTNAPVSGKDQRGYPRPSLPTLCSIGAFDLGTATWYANSSTGNDDQPCVPNTPSTAFQTLATVLPCVGNGDTVTLAAGSYAGGVTLSRGITLSGAGAGASSISGPDGSTTLTIPAGVTAAVSGVTITHNSGSLGAGIVNFGNLAVRASTVTQNTGTCGYGGIYNDNTSTLTIQNSTISHNTSVNSGCAGVGTGGIFSRGSLTITGSTISLNVGGTYGGGLYNDANATLHLINSTVTGNRAAIYGGGIRSFGTTTIVNSTISGNSAGSYGGGIDNPGATAISLTNTILAHNQVDAGGFGPDCSGALADGAGHNLLGIGGTGSNCTYTPGPSDQAGTPPSPLDPMLGSLADNGGPTQTMALLPGSPAIDAGDDGTCSDPLVNSLDQRGAPRPFASHCDIGAFERMAIPVSQGWNLLDLPTSDPTLTSLSALATTLNTQVGTGTVQAEATYASGRFVLYVPGYSADSPLSPTSGIFVLSGHTGVWNGMRTGSGTSFYRTGQTVSLHPGWNLVGAPYPAQGMKASTMAAEINAACAPATCLQEIAIYASGSYQTYLPGGTDLNVPATAGVWIEMSAATSWTPH